MSTVFQRPTGRGGDKNTKPWKLKGPWGEREYPASSRVELYERLYHELVASGLLASSDIGPTNKHHGHVTMLIMGSSWADGHWVRDAK